MGLVEIIVLILAIALVVFTIVYNIVGIRKNKSSCNCGCSGCSKTCDRK